MRKLLLILLVLFCFAASAQKIQYVNTYGYEYQRLVADTLLGLPKDTFLVPASLQSIPFIANKSGSLYLWNISTHVWDLFSSGGGGTDNANIGAFYRWLKPSTQEIKTLANGYGILVDSTTNTNALTLTADTISGTGLVSKTRLTNTISGLGVISGLTQYRTPYAASSTSLTDNANYIIYNNLPGLQGNAGFTILGQVAMGGLYNVNKNKDFSVNRDKTYQLEIIHNDSLYTIDSTSSGAFAITAYENSTGGNSFHVRKARGTQLVPLPVAVGDRIGSYGFKGYATNNEFSNSAAALLAIADEVFTNTATGASISLETTRLAENTRSNTLLLHNSGNVGIGPISTMTSPSADLTILSATGESPSFRMNDADVVLPSYSAVGFQPALDAGTIFNVVPFSTTVGGTQIMGFSESGANTMTPLYISGYHGGTAPTTPGLNFNAWKWNGSTNRTTLANSEIVAQFANGGTILTTLLGSGSLGIGTVSPDRLLHPEISDATTNSIVYPFRMSHTTSATAAIGGGVGLEMETENASGTMRVTGSITNPMTDATNATEDADMVFSNIVAGTLTEKLRLSTSNATYIAAGTTYTLAKTLTNTATLDFGNTLAGTVSDLTLTVTGAADGDAVALGVPNGSYPATGTFTAWVSAANTVTVRYANNSLTLAQDPASGTFRASVIKY